jgi:hypothetical protein
MVGFQGRLRILRIDGLTSGSRDSQWWEISCEGVAQVHDPVPLRVDRPRELPRLDAERLEHARELARRHGPPAIPLRPWAVDQSVEALQDMFRWALAHHHEEISQVGEEHEPV